MVTCNVGLQSSVSEYFSWVREHLGQDWLARTAVMRDAALFKSRVFLAGRPHIGGGGTPEWIFIKVASTSRKDRQQHGIW